MAQAYQQAPASSAHALKHDHLFAPYACLNIREHLPVPQLPHAWSPCTPPFVPWGAPLKLNYRALEGNLCEWCELFAL